MIDPFCRLSATRFVASISFRFGLLLGAAALSLAAGKTVQAQMTTQMLIGDSVSEIGNRYGDVDEAIKRFTNHDVLAARQFLDAAKKKDPNLPPVDMMLAKMYFLAGNVQAGRVSLEKTAMENPEDPEAYLILADQAMQQGRTIDADALYEKGMSIANKFTGNAKRKRNFEIRARSGRAGVAQRRKNWDMAIGDLKALLQVDPDNAAAHYRLGQCMFMQKQFKEGAAEFVAAKKADKNLPEPAVAAALMYDQLKMNNETQQMFDRAMQTSKTDPATLTAYAQWLIKTGAVDKAEGILAEARKSNAGNLNLLILSGVAAHMQKKLKPAEDFFVEALGIAPANVDVINQLALLLIEQPGQPQRDRALQFATMCAQLNAQSPDAQITLAWVLYQLGRQADAETALRSGLQLGNLSPDSSYLVSKILVDQNKGDTAKQILEAALDNDSPGIFIYRKDAQTLLDSLKK
ncbi:MAG TPA: tetratricopeptide repeat protein [Lacipirellulaceae bacterium]|jgi:predicted Zn-dependent protease|nr:tetratricopeptide repeat protein [Lacipirellulaceae bacterium]